jgi:transcription elongation factor Elf1
MNTNKDTITNQKPKPEKRYKCEYCGEKAKVYRMFDIDGTNLEEALVCLNCRDGQLQYTQRLIF